MSNQKTIFFLVLFTAILPFYLRAYDAQRYAIVSSEGRTFLLDTENGTSWRYYFNNVNDQGWQLTSFHIASTETNDTYALKPYGELITVEKPIKIEPEPEIKAQTTTKTLRYHKPKQN